MNFRVPLYLKILLWFFLNLVCVALLFYLFVRAQFRWGLDSLLAGRAGDRIQAVSELMASELNERPPRDWQSVLDRFSEAYQVEFFLFRPDGRKVAGLPVDLPPEVIAKLRDRPMPLARDPPFRRGEQRRRVGRDGDGEGPPEIGPRPPEQPVPPAPGIPRFEGPRPQHPKVMVRTSNPSRYWVMVRIPLPERLGPGPGAMGAVLVAVSNSVRGHGLFFDFVPWLAMGGAVLFFSMLLWFPFVKGLTSNLSQMTRAAERMADGQFDIRIETERRDELGALGHAINQMAVKLSGFVAGQRRFLGDTAHELCSPIARIQMALGILENRLGREAAASLDDMREEIEQMSSLVNELLSFSRASLAAHAVRLHRVRLADVVWKAADREAVGKESIQVDIPPEIEVWAEPELLGRSLANLLRNAVRYAGQAGPIQVAAMVEAETVRLAVRDSGPGAPEEALGHLFDPFYRVDLARDRATGGIGLGLAIVKTCVESCGGSVTCRNLTPSGFEVEIRLKRALAAEVEN